MDRRRIDGTIRASDSASLDAFGRWRVSNPTSTFDNQQQYGDNALFWENQVAGTGLVSSSLLDSSVVLSTGGTATGASAIRQTRSHLRYQPGKSQAVSLTVVFDDGAVENVRRRIGYFNATDGIFLQLTGDELAFVLRSSTSGAPVDTVVAQADWSDDKLDGRGPSRVRIDISKAQILFIDLQWLAAGRVRVGFEIDGTLYYVHQFRNANVLPLAYMATANLPIRCEVENVGIAPATATLRQICVSVLSEGGFETERGLPFSADTTSTLVPVTTARPVLTVRAKLLGPNGVVNTGQIHPRVYDVIATDQACLVKIVRDGVLGGVAPVWTAVDASYSLAEYDRAATTITGGIVVASFGVPAGGGGPFSSAGSSRFDSLANLPLVRTTLNNEQDQLSIVVQAVTGTSNVMATMNWQEFY